MARGDIRRQSSASRRSALANPPFMYNSLLKNIRSHRCAVRPPARCPPWVCARIDAIEPEVAKFQRIDEHIDRAYRIALVDPIIKAFRQQRRLLAIRPLNKTLHQPPAIQQGNHSIDRVFTHSGPNSDIARLARFTRNSMP